MIADIFRDKIDVDVAELLNKLREEHGIETVSDLSGTYDTYDDGSYVHYYTDKVCMIGRKISGHYVENDAFKKALKEKNLADIKARGTGTIADKYFFDKEGAYCPELIEKIYEKYGGKCNSNFITTTTIFPDGSFIEENGGEIVDMGHVEDGVYYSHFTGKEE